MIKLNQIILILSIFFAHFAYGALLNQACNYKKFPVFAGGSKNELVNTFTVDPISNQIFVGGISESSDFAPAENPHGFIYAISEEGDWMWGHFFYNISDSISSIDGIAMSQKNTYITCIGQAKNVPIIMTLSKEKGLLLKFYSVVVT